MRWFKLPGQINVSFVFGFWCRDISCHGDLVTPLLPGWGEGWGSWWWLLLDHTCWLGLVNLPVPWSLDQQCRHLCTAKQMSLLFIFLTFMLVQFAQHERMYRIVFMLLQDELRHYLLPWTYLRSESKYAHEPEHCRYCGPINGQSEKSSWGWGREAGCYWTCFLVKPGAENFTFYWQWFKELFLKRK